MQRPWHLRVFDDPVLLTSDAPVAMRRAGPPGTPMPGIANADAVYWPVDRHHLLSFERPGSASADKVTLNADPSRARVANRLIAAQAEKWIFHHPDEHPLKGLELPTRPELVEETLDVRQTMGELRVTTRVIRRHA